MILFQCCFILRLWFGTDGSGKRAGVVVEEICGWNSVGVAATLIGNTPSSCLRSRYGSCSTKEEERMAASKGSCCQDKKQNHQDDSSGWWTVSIEESSSSCIIVVSWQFGLYHQPQYQEHLLVEKEYIVPIIYDNNCSILSRAIQCSFQREKVDNASFLLRFVAWERMTTTRAM